MANPSSIDQTRSIYLKKENKNEKEKMGRSKFYVVINVGEVYFGS